jgi:DNA-binding NtrC family response regulator
MSFAHPDVIPFPQRAVAVPSAPASEPAPSVLVISHDPEKSRRLCDEGQVLGMVCRSVSSVEAALQSLHTQSADICLVGTLSAGETVAGLVGQIQQKGWSTQVICIVAEASEDAPQLFSSAPGVEHLPVPYTPAVFSRVLTSASQRSRLHAENRRLKRQLSNRNLRDMVGHSQAMQVLRQQVQQVAEQPGCVLLKGEQGTGIDLVAQAIHDSSRRAHRPFVKVDCSVLSAETLEEELFGQTEQEQGGINRHKPGRLEQADGGTLLIDQVQNIALPVQKRLVNLLREQRFEHPETHERIRFDVRFVFGSHIDLAALVDRGLFRRDLHEEICRCTIELPTLRSRKEDIGPLTEHFLRRVAGREGKPARSIMIEALHLLQSYDWPGNVRELENIIERACALDWGSKLTAAMIESWLSKEAANDDPEADALPGMTLAEMERKLIEATFNRFAGNREKTAKALQIGIRTLSGKLREYGYPPRGGPGSNIKAWAPAEETIQIHTDDSNQLDRRAA